MGAVFPQRLNEAQRDVVLVAGEESVGRSLRLRSAVSLDYVAGRLSEFRKETGEHKFITQDGHEEWVTLANRAYQWMSPVSSNASPNPTFHQFPGSHEAIGWKIRVYWNEMGRWYTGRVRAYDQVAGLHKVLFFDGDVRWYTLRNEAVMWLEKIATAKKSTNGITGTAPEGSEAEGQQQQRMKQLETRTGARTNGSPHQRKHLPSTGTSSSSYSYRLSDLCKALWTVLCSMESSQSGRPIHETSRAQRSTLPGGMKLRPRRHSGLDTIHPSFAIIHSRVGIFWATDNKYYRATVQGYNEDNEKFRLLYDDHQEEEIDLEKESFKWLGPKAVSAGYTAVMKEVMLRFRAQNVIRTSSEFNYATSSNDLEQLSHPKEAVGRKLWLYWEATGEKYEAEILAYEARRRLHYLWYRDGELEWVDLKRERFEWDSNNRMVKEFPAGLEEGEPIPRGKAAVGWRIGVYWREDVQFYDGRISKYNADTGRHDVDYDDGQTETLSLSSEKVIWKASPTTGVAQSLESSGSSSQPEKPPPTRKKNRSSVSSPKPKRPRPPSPPSCDLAKENNVEASSLLEEVTVSSSGRHLHEPPPKRPSPEPKRPSEDEEELELYPVMQLPPEPLPSLNQTRQAKLPPQFGAAVFQVKLLAGLPPPQHPPSDAEVLMMRVQSYQTASVKMHRLPTAFEFSASSQLLPQGAVAAEYPTKEMTGMETVTSRAGYPVQRRPVVVRGRGRKKGRSMTVPIKNEMGGTPASLESVLAAFPVSQPSIASTGQNLPAVILPESVMPAKEYSQTLFDSVKLPPLAELSSPDALCSVQDNIGSAGGGGDGPFQGDGSRGTDPV